jgi:hypothetical protein
VVQVQNASAIIELEVRSARGYKLGAFDTESAESTEGKEGTKGIEFKGTEGTKGMKFYQEQ